MNQGELVTALAEKTGLTQVKSKDVIKALTEIMTEQFYLGGEVVFPDVCRLHVQKQAARKAKNPRSGEEILVPEKNVLKVTARTVLKEKINS